MSEYEAAVTMEPGEATVENNNHEGGYKNVFRHKEYVKFVFANTVSRFGDSVDAIAFTWLVYQVTGSAAWSAIIYAMNQLPTVVLQPFAGVWVERMRKKSVIVITHLIRCALILLLVYAYLRQSVSAWILVVFTLIISSVEAFCMPASTALVPHIISKEDYVYGNSFSQSVATIAQLAGMAAAGIVIGIGGIGLALSIDAATFLIAALIILFVRVNRTDENEDTSAETKKTFFTEMKEGLQYIGKNHAVRNFCLMAVFANTFLVPLNALQSPLIVEVFHGGSELLSFFGISVILGMGIGALFTPYLMKLLSARAVVVVAGAVMGGVYYALTMGTYVNENALLAGVVCCACSFVLGMSCSWILGVLNVQFMKTVEEAYLARAAAIFSASASAATPIASALVGALAVEYPVVMILRIAAVCCLLVFIGVGILRLQLE